MAWQDVAAIGFFVCACLLAVYQSRLDGWGGRRNAGTALFLVGVAIGLFLDDILAADSSLLPWIEPIGASVALVGLLVIWFWRPS